MTQDNLINHLAQAGPPTWSSRPIAEVRLDHLCANFETLHTASGAQTTAAVVKCDGYGVGAAQIVRTLHARTDCRHFFVAYPDEGAQLRAQLQSDLGDSTIDVEIFVLGGTDQIGQEICAQHNLTPVLNRVDHAAHYAQHASGKPAILHVDTGMNRLGVPLEDIGEIKNLANLNIAWVMTHLACNLDPEGPASSQQYADFQAIAAQFPKAKTSLKASASMLRAPKFKADMARAGVSLYGTSPFGKEIDEIKPVAYLRAPVLQIRKVPAGTPVGYEHTFVTARPSRLATLAIGYADGLNRAASNKAAVEICGGLAPIVGIISMDLTIIDVTDIAANDDALAAAQATIFGDRPTIQQLAQNCSTIPYELLTRLGPRIIRKYV